MTATDAQQIQLLHQIQQHLLTNNQAFLLYIALMLPLPVAWRLSFYNWLTSLPLPPIPPLMLIILISVGPILIMLFLYFFVKFLLEAIRILIPFTLSRITKQIRERKFLELTFPSDTSKSAYATEQLYSLFHTLARQKSFIENLTQFKNIFSLEIVSTKASGIRYLLVVEAKYADLVKRSLLSYLPGLKIREVPDYFDSGIGTDINTSPSTSVSSDPKSNVRITELKLNGHFALPLESQKALSEHDPISYLTGNMTKLNPGDLISFQVVVTPVQSSTHHSLVAEMNKLRGRIYKGMPLTPSLDNGTLKQIVSLPGAFVIVTALKLFFELTKIVFIFVVSLPAAILEPNDKTSPLFQTPLPVAPQEILNPYEVELRTVVKGKIDQPLFESSLRLLITSSGDTDLEGRLSGLIAAFGPLSSAYQRVETKTAILGSLGSFSLKQRWMQFQGRLLSSSNVFQPNPVLSASELADIYHFPYTDTTKTEDLVKSSSSDLPAPLSMKQDKKFDIIVGRNTYGGQTTEIGLTEEDRWMHEVIYGGTGKGKSTLLLYQLAQDIKNGKGVGLIDPHGDLAEEVVACIPKSRENDLVYINPFEIGRPVAINILELAEGLSEDELEIEKEFVTEGLVSLFRKEFAKEGEAHAHRLEYILRNCIYTAYTTPSCTMFTIYDLLNDPQFRKKTVTKLSDKRLKKFWQNESGKAGDFQRVKMAFGVTSKIGRFLFSPMAKRILDNPRSSINFDEILNGHILIANLSKGNLGDDTSELLGKMLLTKLQQAALKRARIKKRDRRHFYLYIDEFQNFATKSFVDMMSDDRKYHVHLVLVQQSTSQQTDLDLTNLTLANAGIVIVFRTAAPKDEEMLLPLFYPLVKKGEIQNLSAYHFYMKISAITSEEAFSGETVLTEVPIDEKRIEALKELSRSRYTIDYHAKIKDDQMETKEAVSSTRFSGHFVCV